MCRGLDQQSDAPDVELLATIAHDLRQPLTVVQVSAQVLRHQVQCANPASAVWLDRGIAQIEEAGLWMVQLIDELMDLVRIQSSDPRYPNRHPTDLTRLAARAVAAASMRDEGYRVRLERTQPSMIGYWDAAALRRVLENLLSNAMKYSLPGREILVRVASEMTLDGVWAVLVVRDHGRGIPAADQPHIFEPFWRGSNIDQVAGSGLGLSSVKRIVETHGGSIAIESREGEGTTVTVRLPQD
jgi:signal transduction histidine kinase